MRHTRHFVLLLVSAALFVPAVARADRPDHARDREPRAARAGDSQGHERQRFRRSSPEQRQQLDRQRESRRKQRWQRERQHFREATPAERARMRERFERRLRSPRAVRAAPERATARESRRPVSEDESRELHRRFEQLPEPERERVRANAAHFRSLSDADQNRLRGALRHLRELSPDERRRTLERLLED